MNPTNLNQRSRRAKLLRTSLYRISAMVLLAALVAGGTSCSSKKKLAKQQEAERLAKISAAKAEVLSILNNKGDMSLEEKEAKLQKVKDMNLNDPELNDMIKQAEFKLKREREIMDQKEAERLKAEEERLKAEKEKTVVTEEMKMKELENHFEAIANSDDLSYANKRIDEALNMFAAGNIPVLIIIYKGEDGLDYDEPTTIEKYLNFLKDQKKNLNAIENIKYGDDGKIIELELIKK